MGRYLSCPPKASQNAPQQLRRLEEAISHYRAGLALDPQSADSHINLGAALAQLGRIQEALPHFEAACRLEPDDLSARGNLARARAMLGLSPDDR